MNPNIDEIIHDLTNAIVSLRAILLQIEKTRDINECHDWVNKAISRVDITMDFLKLQRSKKPLAETNEVISNLRKIMPIIRTNYSDLTFTIVAKDVHYQKFHPPLFYNALINIIVNSMEAGASKMVITVDKQKVCFTDNGKGIEEKKTPIPGNLRSTKGKNRGYGITSIKNFCTESGWELVLKNGCNHNSSKTGLTVCFTK